MANAFDLPIVFRSAVELPRRSGKLTLQLAHALKDHIAQTRPAIGTRLPSVKTLAAHFGVSMPSVREALIALEALGYVDLVHGVGTLVRKAGRSEPSQDNDTITLLEARRLLEGTVAALAAKEASEKTIGELALAMQTLFGAKPSDPGDGIRAFHMCVGRLTGNGAIMMAVDQLWQPGLPDVMEETLWGQALLHGFPAWMLMHQRIYEAIRRKSAGAAETAMNDFNDQAMADVFFILEKREVEKAEQVVAGKRQQFATRRLTA